MKPKYFVGIDVSKLTLDIAVVKEKTVIENYEIENSEASLKTFLRTLHTDHKCTNRNTFYCAEQMGIYNAFLKKVCIARKLEICLESPLHLKRSLGLQRGKNDKVDAQRIAQYAAKNFQQLKLWQPPRPELTELKNMSTIRKKLLKMKGMCISTRTAETHFLSSKEKSKYSAYTKGTVEAIKKDIASAEARMEEIITSDDKLDKLMTLITSVPCIGSVTGMQLIMATNEFETGWTARKFASYCGIAPFEWISGTSVKGKTKVSHLANKEVKSLLHMAAMSTIRSKKSFLAKYYERKVAEGKSKMSVLNAVRNKLLQRVFACVRKNKLYTDINY